MEAGHGRRFGARRGHSHWTVRWAYESFLARVGRPDQAIPEVKQALQLDPVSSHSFMNASFIAYYARRYDGALALIQRTLALHPDLEVTLCP